MMSNKTYDILKQCTMTWIPAFTTFFVTLDSIFGWGLGNIVAKVSAAVCTLLGTLLGISNKRYYNALNNGIYADGNEDEADE